MNPAEMFTDLLQVLLAGLVLGAGLPALFATGIRLAAGPSTTAADGTIIHTGSAPVWRKLLASVCFAVIVFSVVLGIMWITKAVIYDSFGWDIFGTQAAASH